MKGPQVTSSPEKRKHHAILKVHYDISSSTPIKFMKYLTESSVMFTRPCGILTGPKNFPHL